MNITEYETQISKAKGKILELQKDIQNNVEDSGKTYKHLGDLYINYYIDSFLLEKELKSSLLKLSYEAYENACRIFLENKMYVGYIYSLMAFGNAYKESFLPKMNKDDFIQLYQQAKGKYKKGIDLYFSTDKSFPKEYHFLMLEQINLEIRRKVWESFSQPQRVNIFHSLKSAISHATLEGLCFYSYLHNIEIWEYRYGEVRTFDKEKKFIKDRLNEASIVIFLLSEDYSTERDIVKFEVEETLNMLKNNDPMQVFGIDLGNKDLVKQLSKNTKIYKIDEIDKIFIENKDNSKSIYDCRLFRKQKAS